MKKLIKSMNVNFLVLFVVSMALIIPSFSGFVTSFQPAVSFEDLLDGREIKIGSHISGNVVYALDYFAAERTYQKTKAGAIIVNKKAGNYYIIPAAEGFLGLKTAKNQNMDFDKLTDETYTFLKGGQKPQSKIYIDGDIIPMKQELVSSFHNYLSDAGYTQEEILNMGAPLLIRPRSFLMNRIFFVSGLIFLYLSFSVLWYYYRRSSFLEEFSRDMS